MIFVVPIAYNQSIDNNNELKYMLRSLEKNYKEEFDVIVIGDKPPDWYIGEFIHFERQATNIDYENFYDTLSKLEYLATNLEENNFVYIYDDVCLLKEIDNSFFDTVYHIPYPSGFNKWNATIRRSLELKGGLNYESHIPVMFDRRKLKMMFQTFRFSFGSVPYAPISLYFNIFKPFSKELEKELCYNEIKKESIWLNYIDKYYLNLKLDKIFTKKGKYESST